MNRNKDARRKLIVIGNGMAAMITVEAVLKKKPELAMTIFGDEQQTNYNRILLSNVLAGKTDAGKIVLHPKSWYAEHGIELRQGIPVTSIDAEAKIVYDARGQASPYDWLLFATGAVPVIPPIDGAEKNGVFVFRTLADTEKIVAAASKEMEALVIGGGLLGLEAARGLINYGLKVTVVHLADRLMEQQLDATGAALLKQEIERMGIRVLLETTAEMISGEKSVREVRLSTGESLPAGMVVICTGIRPNTALAHTTGLKIARGIVVDDRMETSLPGIFAVGDVIEHRGRTYGLIAPLKEQAGVIADALAGQDEKRYAGTVCATTLKVAGISLTSAGELGRRAGGEELAFLDTDQGIYKKCVLRQNRLTGFILLGDNRDGTRLFGLLKKGSDLSAIKDQLLGNVSIESGADPPASGATALADSDTVCNCNDVSKGTIVNAIRKKGLKNRDEVAACTEASTGCGSCGEIVDDLLRMVNQLAPSAQAISLSADASDKKKMPSSTKLLDLEKIKQEGLGIDFARIKKEGSRAVSMDDKYRLKTYGICVQKHLGYSIVRIRIPGGRVTSEQVRHLTDLATVHGRGQIHLTIRQNMELHWVRVEEAEDIFARLRKIGLTTRSTCGHTLRNVMACPHGAVSKEGILDVQPWAALISDYFIQRSDLINPTMPNRLNIYFSGCSRCKADAVINDIAFVAVRRKNKAKQDTLGFEVWVGGSLGSKPILGYKLRDFIPLSDALPVCQAVFEIHTKHGNRNKARSRLKFLIEQWGIEKFTETFDKVFIEKKGMPENRGLIQATRLNEEKTPWFGKGLSAALIPTDLSTLPSGVVPQKQRGLASLTIAIPLGEIRAETLSEIGKIARRFGNGVLYFTKEQDITLQGIPMRSIGRTVKALKQLGLSLKESESGPTLLACPGIEFCTLAITHAQGAARELINRFRPTTEAKKDLFNAISIHISGCPNSCAKHQVADIGLAGTLLPVGDARRYSYQLFLGGNVSETIQLGEMVRKGITEEMVVPTVDALLDIVLTNCREGEVFKTVISRLGPKAIAKLLEKKIAPFVPQPSEALSMVTTELIEVRS